MTITIAVAGKGGTGKTTFSGLLVRYLRDRDAGNILAIDADPATNLHSVLGMPEPTSVGNIREETAEQVGRGQGVPSGMSKHDYFEYQVNMAVEEGNGFDLIAMGRPEGRGCYCAANNMLRVIIDQVAGGYDYVVMDNEAGLEHLSRRTTRDVDVMLIVSDPSMRGIVTAGRVLDLSHELKNVIGRTYLVVNRVQGELPPPIAAKAEELGLKLAGIIPADPLVPEFDGYGRPLIELPAESPAWQAAREIANQVLN
ncbi:MAG: AAA family ATPase [Chloroflexi bacterium]|nr:AAA family ATPase [Chloroflexota bacterium]MBU1749815.1 AAA family ATPase [Chloroflexota bacterium]MBU1880207.1 AAA family ATPase [Chloroflexota bacterium]